MFYNKTQTMAVEVILRQTISSCLKIYCLLFWFCFLFVCSFFLTFIGLYDLLRNRIFIFKDGHRSRKIVIQTLISQINKIVFDNSHTQTQKYTDMHTHKWRESESVKIILMCSILVKASLNCHFISKQA